ncbi:MAG TPA: type II toxin-antitoxin system RelE/ParE family toxin [Candidatus Baltobacteraceae bacterium]|nr:type II toxin-antitoxin system RelE/ParE family toxin [Candidatus Baltobacteraceae bacterium]
MRIFKNKSFGRFADKAPITDPALREAVAEIGRGLHDGDLGGGVFKKRIARAGAGKSGGFRTIVLYKVAQLAIFVFGFAKSDRDNIDDNEKEAFKKLAKEMLAYDDEALEKVVDSGVLIEVKEEDEEYES